MEACANHKNRQLTCEKEQKTSKHKTSNLLIYNYLRQFSIKQTTYKK